jgi:hypothetical protein
MRVGGWWRDLDSPMGGSRGRELRGEVGGSARLTSNQSRSTGSSQRGTAGNKNYYTV